MTNHYPNPTVTNSELQQQTNFITINTRFRAALNSLAKLVVQGVTMLSCASITQQSPARSGLISLEVLPPRV